MNKALPRFSSISATGGTPLEDGIQFALQSLNNRHERHRIVLVLTDGMPDNAGVVRRQIRQAADAHVDIVGVCLQSNMAIHVRNLFPKNVCVQDISALPNALSSYLEGVVFPRRAKKLATGDAGFNITA